jgi:hypothetical protein
MVVESVRRTLRATAVRTGRIPSSIATETASAAAERVPIATWHKKLVFSIKRADNRRRLSITIQTQDAPIGAFVDSPQIK